MGVLLYTSHCLLGLISRVSSLVLLPLKHLAMEYCTESALSKAYLHSLCITLVIEHIIVLHIIILSLQYSYYLTLLVI
jgi:hypothetical protein